LTLSHEFVLAWPVMNKDDIGIATPSDVQCLAGADCDNPSRRYSLPQ